MSHPDRHRSREAWYRSRVKASQAAKQKNAIGSQTLRSSHWRLIRWSLTRSASALSVRMTSWKAAVVKTYASIGVLTVTVSSTRGWEMAVSWPMVWPVPSVRDDVAGDGLGLPDVDQVDAIPLLAFTGEDLARPVLLDGHPLGDPREGRGAQAGAPGAATDVARDTARPPTQSLDDHRLIEPRGGVVRSTCYSPARRPSGR